MPEDMITTLTTAPHIDDAPPKRQAKVLSLVIAPCEQHWRGYLGISMIKQNLSPWPGGILTWPEMPNRAGYKLLEALSDFRIKLRANAHALDLGAAPGAWALVLRQHGLYVTAVAPKLMYTSLRRDPMITHKTMKAEDYLNHVKTKFDLITNDMIVDVQDSARLMVSYAKHLRPEGKAIMTVKLRQRKNRKRVMNHTFRLLRQAYRIVRVHQLVSNRREVTLFLRKNKKYIDQKEHSCYRV